ncbi:hypothetical protein [Halomicrobium sp. LC1Hm]|uniref:hypothetical protein n=1 Tax=Halomicrobium sp. LC1Hm TaxID=2610902 RepID=UPI0012983B5E|nr:hypothetical protein [Halomicrobium sp. LC1Hm]QGA83909.1 ABC-2 family transporter [Halomicrobium sp. LC1Hm]
MTRQLDRFWTVFAREVRGLVRTRVVFVLGAVVAALAFGVARAGGGPSGGYVTTVVDLLVVVELLVPAAAFAIGYRALADATARGEPAVLETYPLSPWTYVAGVYAGRAVALLAVVVVPLLALGAHVATTAGPETTVLATHRGVDSVALYVRFVALTALLGLVTLAVALALSAVANSRRRAILLGLFGLLLVVAGTDVTVLTALGGGLLDESALGTVLALTPSGAYRGLVFEHVLSVAFEGRSGFVPTGLALVTSLCWWASGLSLAALWAGFRYSSH